MRSKRSYEAEKKRAAGEIHRLRGQVAAINSQMSQVRQTKLLMKRQYFDR
jgi:DNA-binding FrmR family transcriptional regulator